MKEDLSKARTSDLKEQLHKHYERAVICWVTGGIFLLLGLIGLGDLLSHGLAMLFRQEPAPLDPLVWLSVSCLVVALCAGAVSLVYLKRYRLYNNAFKQRRETLTR